jgi:bacterioferritin
VLPVYEKSIELLNRAVADEMTAVHQYMYFHFHCDDQGYDPLSALFRQTAIEEMIHVERLAERILFLKGEVEMVASGEVNKIHDVRKMLDKGKAMEQNSVRDYNLWANECGANADSASKQLFESLVADEERHFDQYDTQEEHIEKFGEQFLALQSIERSKNLAGPPQGTA